MDRSLSILVVEDESGISSLVTSVLEEGGFSAEVVDTAAKCRAWLKKSIPKLVILDRNLPDGDGLDLCSEIRERPALQEIPVLFLTAQKSVNAKVEGLRRGGDDYITKPFSAPELLARVEVLLRRCGALKMPEVLESGKLKLDLPSRKAILNGKPVDLWAKEFDLLWLLMSQPNRVLTRDFVLQQVWGYELGDQPSTKIVDVTLSHLRAKLGTFAHQIVSVRGYGYRFDSA